MPRDKTPLAWLGFVQHHSPIAQRPGLKAAHGLEDVAIRQLGDDTEGVSFGDQGRESGILYLAAQISPQRLGKAWRAMLNDS